MKTLIIWQEGQDIFLPDFYIVEGDYRELDGVCLNSCAAEGESEISHDIMCKRLSDLMYNEDWTLRHTKLESSPSKDSYDFIIRAGVLP